jgi:hypothetical protein
MSWRDVYQIARWRLNDLRDTVFIGTALRVGSWIRGKDISSESTQVQVVAPATTYRLVLIHLSPLWPADPLRRIYLCR